MKSDFEITIAMFDKAKINYHCDVYEYVTVISLCGGTDMYFDRNGNLIDVD